MELALIIGLIAIGIIFLIVEVFLIPGISVAGIGSALCFIAGIYLAYTKLGNTEGSITLGVSALASAFILYQVYRSKALDKMALKTSISTKPDPFNGLKVKVGDIGVSISRLGPIGKIQINNIIIEGRSENELLDSGTDVIVTQVDSYNVVVRKHIN